MRVLVVLLLAVMAVAVATGILSSSAAAGIPSQYRYTGWLTPGGVRTDPGPERNTPRLEVRIFDPSGRIASEVSAAELVLPSAKASRESDGTGTLFFSFTAKGAAAFHSLTRALARRGARLHRLQRFAIEINGHVYGRPLVDYRAFPDGLLGDSGFEIHGLRLTVAKKLARAFHNG